MFRYYHVAVFLLLAHTNIYAACECAKSKWISNLVPNTVFTFSDNRRIVLCGFKNVDIPLSQAEYSEFVISECGIDTVTKFWGPSENVIAFLENDTLHFNYTERLATGANFDLTSTTWAIEYIYYDQGLLHLNKKMNPQLHYTPEQVKTTLAQYSKIKWKTQAETKDEKKAERMMQIANQLMVAAISGSYTAEKYFHQFAKKFQPTGGYAEWYSDMEDILDFAKNGSDSP
jgi:hypothetical protein